MPCRVHGTRPVAVGTAARFDHVFDGMSRCPAFTVDREPSPVVLLWDILSVASGGEVLFRLQARRVYAAWRLQPRSSRRPDAPLFCSLPSGNKTMKLAETNYDNAETGCCARLDPAAWDGRELTWDEKPFLRDHIREFLHIPLNYGSVISRDHAAIEDAGAYPEEPFWLTDEVSPWGADIYTAVDGDVPGVEIEKMSGTYLTKVFEGPYRKVGEWVKEMEGFVTGQGREMHKVYFYYATCPKCAKRFGQNHVVLFAQVE